MKRFPPRWSVPAINWVRLQSIRHSIVISLIVLFALYLGFMLTLPAPITLTTLSGITEHVQFTVTDRRLGTIPTAGMKVTGREGSCLPASIIPDMNAVISYRRTLTDRLIVSLEQGGAIVPENGSEPASRIAGPIDFIADSTCQAKDTSEIKCDDNIKGSCSQHRLPIWGRVSMGHESALVGSQGGGTFLEGTLKVQARALPTYMGMRIGDSSMYSVLDMTLPVGARIEADNTGDRPSSWWGLGYIDPQKPGLQIVLATEAPAFKIFRPFPTTPDLISVSGFTQSMQDPNLIRIQLVIIGLLAIMNFVGLIKQLFGKS